MFRESFGTNQEYQFDFPKNCLLQTKVFLCTQEIRNSEIAFFWIFQDGFAYILID